MKDPYKKIEDKLPEANITYRVKNSQKDTYAPGRDILNFYASLQRAVVEVVATRHPDKEEDINKLEKQINGFINEANIGKQKLTLAQFVEMQDAVMKVIDKEVVDDYTRLMCAAFMFRFVSGKRERPKERIQAEEVGKAFQALYILSVLPDDLEEKVTKHIRAYKHVPGKFLDSDPTCVVEEDNEGDE